MVGLRKRALSAVLGAASLCAATQAGAMIVVTVTPGGAGGVAFGTIDLSAYLSDAQGRTFSISAATLSARAHSDPNYGPVATTTVDTNGAPQVLSFNPLTIELDVNRIVTNTYTDNFADSLTLGNGILGPAVQTVSGTVSQILDTTETIDGGVSDGPLGPLFPFAGFQRTTLTTVNVHHALYGSLDLSEDFNAASLAQANLMDAVTYVLTPGLTGLGGIFGGGFDPTQSFTRNQFTVDSVSLAFDLTQTAGPPPDAPQFDGGVPEPTAWALMVAGLAALGAALRRRRTGVVGAREFGGVSG